jgi:hypothetical protein
MLRNGEAAERSLAANLHARERDYWLAKLSGEWQKSIFPYDGDMAEKNDRPESSTLEAESFGLQG